MSFVTFMEACYKIVIVNSDFTIMQSMNDVSYLHNVGNH
jgi:hypothetical protein